MLLTQYTIAQQRFTFRDSMGQRGEGWIYPQIVVPQADSPTYYGVVPVPRRTVPIAPQRRSIPVLPNLDYSGPLPPPPPRVIDNPFAKFKEGARPLLLQ